MFSEPRSSPDTGSWKLCGHWTGVNGKGQQCAACHIWVHSYHDRKTFLVNTITVALWEPRYVLASPGGKSVPDKQTSFSEVNMYIFIKCLHAGAVVTQGPHSLTGSFPSWEIGEKDVNLKSNSYIRQLWVRVYAMNEVNHTKGKETEWVGYRECLSQDQAMGLRLE